MSKDKKNKKNKSSAKSKAEATSKVISNPRLVSAIQGFDAARAQAKTFLVDVATIVQEEQCTKAEVVASLVEARGCTEKTAKEQYSRMKKILSDPEALEALRNGEVDLKTAREQTTKKQKNPSQEKAKQNAEKRFSTSLSGLINAAKEQGTDLATLLNTVKAAAKKNGIK